MTTGLRDALAGAADPRKAAAMQAYLKTDQPFYGVQAGPRRLLFRQLRQGWRPADRAEYEQVVRELWHGECREEMHLALDFAQQFREYRGKEAFPLFVELMREASNWDTLDWLATGLVGPLVREHRRFERQVRAWRRDRNMWMRRASLLVHLKHKGDTNTELLAETIDMLAPESEFFIRKAIGWVLREYARTDPEWVRAFVAEREGVLSGLSRREALKHLA